jgi:integrase
MTQVRLRYVNEFIDRHGHARFYFRRGGKRVPLPGLPHSREFIEAYQALLAGPAELSKPQIGASRIVAGTVGQAVVGYLASGDFRALATSSQQQYRRILEGFAREHGEKRVVTLDRRGVVELLDAKADTPVAARDFLRCLRCVIAYAISIGIRQDDPTAGVRMKMPKSDGFRTWTEDDIAAFETAYPVGSKPRLALALLVGTAQRCADVVRMGRAHVRGGKLRITQQKTGRSLAIPITEGKAPTLAEVINASAPTEHLTFLLNDRGRAFTARGFSKWFVKQCRNVGLDGLSAHGLRKAACRRLAEAGCSANEIAAISGHASLREVARYTKAVDQERMAENAIRRMAAPGGNSGRTRIGNPGG